MRSEYKWIIGILLVLAILMIGGEVALLFIGVPVALAILFGVMMVADRALGLHNNQNNPWKLTIYAVILIATVLFTFWLGSLTGWRD